LKKTTSLWFACLAVLLSSCGQKKTDAAPEQAPPAVGVGVAAAADSATRFELWLMTHQPDKASIPVIAPGKIAVDLLKGLDVPGLVTRVGMPEWQALILWSWDDMGPVEPEAQRELERLDDKYMTNSYSACIWPGPGMVGRVGRSCVMQSYTCFAARNKLDDRTMDVTVAVEMPNEEAMRVLKSAGANAIGEFIRVTKFCK